MRLGYKSDPAKVAELMVRFWKMGSLHKPQLVISVIGNAAYHELSDKTREEIFEKGLIRVRLMSGDKAAQIECMNWHALLGDPGHQWMASDLWREPRSGEYSWECGNKRTAFGMDRGWQGGQKNPVHWGHGLG